MNALITVIIPAYNSAKYIVDCIESVTGQTYRSLEILLIDDGSQDDTKDICRGMCEKDERIRLISKEHEGVSAARNRGIEEARGKYLFFMDSDDVIHPRLIEKLAGRAERSHLEMVFCDYVKMSDRQIEAAKKRIHKNHTKCQWKTKKTPEAEEWFHTKHLKQLSCIGGKLIEREFAKKQRFDEELARGEDTLFLYYLTRKEMTMAYLNKQWYYYRNHSESAAYFAKESIDEHNYNAIKRIRDSEFKRGSTVWAAEWEYRLVWMLLTGYLTMKEKKDTEGCQVVKKMILTERKHPLYCGFSVWRRILFDGLYIGCAYFWPFRKLWILKRRKVWGR